MVFVDPIYIALRFQSKKGAELDKSPERLGLHKNRRIYVKRN